MALGNQVNSQSRIRPVRSLVAAAPGSSGVGVAYGMGVGSVRVSGISYSIADASGLYVMSTLNFIARIVVINGDYPNDATQFLYTTDLTGGTTGQGFDVLFDRFVQNVSDSLPTWFSGMVTDEGLRAVALISQLFFPAGPPPGIQPQSVLLLHADHYATREQALSPGSIFEVRDR